ERPFETPCEDIALIEREELAASVAKLDPVASKIFVNDGDDAGARVASRSRKKLRSEREVGHRKIAAWDGRDRDHTVLRDRRDRGRGRGDERVDDRRAMVDRWKELLARRAIPHHRASVEARGDDGGSVAAEARARDRLSMTELGHDLRSGRDVPDASGAVGARADDVRSVGMKLYRANEGWVLQHVDLFAVRPHDVDAPIAASARKDRSIRAPRKRAHVSSEVSIDLGGALRRGQPIDVHEPRLVARCDVLAVARERDRADGRRMLRKVERSRVLGK